MRWHILKALLYKEALRHATNRGGLLLAGLLVAASLVLSAFNRGGDKAPPLLGGIHHCYIHAADLESPWVRHLREHLPPELANRVIFKELPADLQPDSEVLYPPGTGAIQIRRTGGDSAGPGSYVIWLRHPAGDRAGMAAYEGWFWRETYRFFHDRAAEQVRAKGLDPAKVLPNPDVDRDDLWDKRIVGRDLWKQAEGQGVHLSELEWHESAQAGAALDMHAAIATALVMFALFFTCVYLMPSLTCEERERGLLLAQVLSPARVRELLAAKFFFYPTFGIFLATLLAGIHNPEVLLRWSFWLSLVFLSLGSLGIGMSIASLARTQRSASLAALCYMLVVALVLLICQQNNITLIPYAFLEYHAPQLLHATMTGQERPGHQYNLIGSGVLAVGWVFLAGFLFRRRGWQ